MDNAKIALIGGFIMKKFAIIVFMATMLSSCLAPTLREAAEDLAIHNAEIVGVLLEEKIVSILMIGKRESFYDLLKRRM